MGEPCILKKTEENSTQNNNDRWQKKYICQLLREYDIETTEDIQDALKDLLGGTIKEMCMSHFVTVTALWEYPKVDLLTNRKVKKFL